MYTLLFLIPLRSGGNPQCIMVLHSMRKSSRQIILSIQLIWSLTTYYRTKYHLSHVTMDPRDKICSEHKWLASRVALDRAIYWAHLH